MNYELQIIVAHGNSVYELNFDGANTIIDGWIKYGAVNSIVCISALGGCTISATISDNVVEELGLKEREPVLAVIKATSVMVGIDWFSGAG